MMAEKGHAFLYGKMIKRASLALCHSLPTTKASASNEHKNNAKSEARDKSHAPKMVEWKDRVSILNNILEQPCCCCC